MSADGCTVHISNPLARAAAWTPLGFLFAASLAVAAASSLRPRETGRLAAVFPPWWSAERSLATASRVAAVTGVGGFPFIVGVAGTRPGMASELEEAGAVVVLDGSRFPACFPRP